jgi:hypothetical protein
MGTNRVLAGAAGQGARFDTLLVGATETQQGMQGRNANEARRWRFAYGRVRG